MVKVTITFRSNNPNTIASVLARKLGREPTSAELCAEVRRIKGEALTDLAAAGRLPHQQRLAK